MDLGGLGKLKAGYTPEGEPEIKYTLLSRVRGLNWLFIPMTPCTWPWRSMGIRSSISHGRRFLTSPYSEDTTIPPPRQTSPS